MRATGGPWGNYQKLCIALSCFTTIGPSVALIWGIAFLVQTPALLCQTDGSGEWETCSREIACQSPETFKIDYDDPLTVRNFITDLDLVCVESYDLVISNLEGTLLLGILIGFIFVLPLADIYGRKKTLAVVSHIALASFVLAFYAWKVSQDLFLLRASLFLIGVSKFTQVMTAYIGLTELLTSDQMALTTGFAEGVIALQVVIFCLYIRYYKDTVTYMAVSIVSLAVWSAFMHYWFLETPAYLLKSG